MLYTDDGHLYVCFKPTDATFTRIQMETLAADRNDWFIANNLMSNNDDKLVALLINGQRCKPIIFTLLTVGDGQMPVSDCLRSWGRQYNVYGQADSNSIGCIKLGSVSLR